MSVPEINRVLDEMRALSARAVNTPAPKTEGVDFASLLGQSLNKVNATQQESVQLATNFERGVPGTELPDVMLSMQRASLSFRAMTEVRNKLVDAYQAIMNMPV